MGMKSSGDSHVYIERRKSTHTQDSNQISILMLFLFLVSCPRELQSKQYRQSFPTLDDGNKRDER